MPDSMADIFGNDYKPPPPEISEQPEPQQEKEKLTEIKQVAKPIEPKSSAVNETLIVEEKEIPKVSHSQEKDIQNDKNPEKGGDLLEEKKELKEQQSPKKEVKSQPEQKKAESKSGSDDSSSSSFSSDSDEQVELKQKLERMRALLKQKKIDQAKHKKALIKEANHEKKREEKSKQKER